MVAPWGEILRALIEPEVKDEIIEFERLIEAMLPAHYGALYDVDKNGITIVALLAWCARELVRRRRKDNAWEMPQ